VEDLTNDAAEAEADADRARGTTELRRVPFFAETASAAEAAEAEAVVEAAGVAEIVGVEAEAARDRGTTELLRIVACSRGWPLPLSMSSSSLSFARRGMELRLCKWLRL